MKLAGPTKEDEDYTIVNLVDVNEFLSFAKKEYKELEQQIKEEERVERELKKFISEIAKYSKHIIHYIGHEKRYGTHLVRFLFKQGGFLEVIVQKPVTLNAHFIDAASAKKFAAGLKKTLQKWLPDTPIKQLIIDSIKIETGKRENEITIEKWTKLHRIALHHTVVITFTALLVYVILESTKAYFAEISKGVLHYESIIISMSVAVVLSFSFDPIRAKIEQIIEKVFGK